MVKILRNNARLAKWYGGRLENGYAQACRGSNPLPGAHNFILLKLFFGKDENLLFLMKNY
jgi:hypothetical protein